MATVGVIGTGRTSYPAWLEPAQFATKTKVPWTEFILVYSQYDSLSTSRRPKFQKTKSPPPV